MIFEKLKELISEQFSVSEDAITLDTAFVDDLGADSLDLVEMLMTFEDTYGFCIEDEDAEKLRTVRDVVEYIENNVE